MTAFSQTRKKTLAVLLEERCPTALRHLAVTGVALDSRNVAAGDLFVALAGASHDGRRFIGEALERGCAAVVAEEAGIDEILPGTGALRQALDDRGVPLVACRDLASQVSAMAGRFYDQPGRTLTVYGVTGTNGKTTCSNLIAQLQGILHGCAGLIGTLGCGLVGRGSTGLAETGMTTPDAVALQRNLAELRDQGARHVAMEVSSHSLDQHRADGAGIRCAIFTNLSRDHLDYHGDEHNYRTAKARLFALPGIEYAVINGDDAVGRSFLAQLPDTVQGYSYGIGGAWDVRAENPSFCAQGIGADVHSPWGSGRLESALLGEFNLYNLLAAITAVCAAGEDFTAVLAALPQLKPVAGRMDVVAPGTRPAVVVDYAHTPDALEKALRALRGHAEGKLWCVFGCGGDRDAGKRPLMAQVAEQHADQVVVTSDNPRSEDPSHIITDIAAGFAVPAVVAFEVDRRAAIRYTILNAEPEDSVLIAGKGHENYQQVGMEKRPFSDVQEARDALAARATHGEGAP
ncbi:MAG: UDP-N-acetylmuramoyl-L-alanyl-D-glutamate--2,6-diaminopimelate ligase [Pseudomonas sp.]